MDSKVKQKLKTFLLNGQIQEALRFIDLVETIDGNYTDSQRKGVWKYMTMKAEQLNDAGLDVRKVMKPTFNIPWTKDMVHDLLWIPIQKVMYRTKTMRSLKKLQVSEIYKVIEREFGEKHHLDSIPFPCDEERQKEEATTMKNIEMAKKIDYPTEEYKEPLI